MRCTFVVYCNSRQTAGPVFKYRFRYLCQMEGRREWFLGDSVDGDIGLFFADQHSLFFVVVFCFFSSSVVYLLQRSCDRIYVGMDFPGHMPVASNATRHSPPCAFCVISQLDYWKCALFFFTRWPTVQLPDRTSQISRHDFSCFSFKCAVLGPFILCPLGWIILDWSFIQNQDNCSSDESHDTDVASAIAPKKKHRKNGGTAGIGRMRLTGRNKRGKGHAQVSEKDWWLGPPMKQQQVVHGPVGMRRFQ